MKILFPQKKYHIPKWYIVDATNKSLGYLSTLIIKYLIGKENCFYTSNVNQGNYVIIVNINKINITKKKQIQKLYFKNSNRPGSLKIETLKDLQNKLSTKFFEKSIKCMLLKNIIGRQYYKRLYIYSKNNIIK